MGGGKVITRPRVEPQLSENCAAAGIPSRIPFHAILPLLPGKG